MPAITNLTTDSYKLCKLMAKEVHHISYSYQFLVTNMNLQHDSQHYI